MIFTSIIFVLFFLVVIILNYLLPANFRWIWLLFASIFFYMYIKPVYILVPLFIILITYFAGINIQKADTKQKATRLYFWGVLANVGLLVVFKYTDFFSNSIFDLVNSFRNASRVLPNTLLINVIAPLGISYMTFQAIGYLIEIKRENHLPEKHIGHLALFILFFPKVTAGPVERAHRFLPQIEGSKSFDYHNFTLGLKQILWGAFKKLVIANRLEIYINAVFNNSTSHSGLTLLLASIFYVFQMYADFSGYTDMALGLAKMLGYNLTPNFNRPLFAKSVTEFWRKWHISLSTWFADYFYTPLAIAKRDWGKWSVVYASFVTFITLGFWHGANWTFIIFGSLQGFILSIEFFTRKSRKNFQKKIPTLITNSVGNVFTICYFAFSLIFFRANSVNDAGVIIKRIFTSKGALFFDKADPSSFIFCFFGIIFLLLVESKQEFYKGSISFFDNKNWLIRNLSYSALIIIILLIGVFDGGQFIYFQF